MGAGALKVAVIQHAAGRDVAANLQRLEALLDRAGPADLVLLPEVFGLRGSDDDYRAVAEPADGGRLTAWLSGQARTRGTWVLGGSILERAGDEVFNTSLLMDRQGRRVALYRKIHLFEARLENGQVIRERDVYAAGDEPILATIEGWRVGLSICYDVRFPELFRLYAAGGASLLVIPSNFTQRTGRDHWSVLVRARAIENQCFVAAPNQCGANPVSGIASHGHSLIVGPWGEILAEAGDDETVLRVTLDPADLARVRKRIPALEHRRL